MPTICIRPGLPNKAASGFFSNILREPLAGKEVVLPVSEDVRHWHATPRSAVGFLLHAATLDSAAVGPRRNLTMPGLSATVGEQIAALKRVAGDKVAARIKREPDPFIMGIVDGWPRNFDAEAGAPARLHHRRKDVRRHYPDSHRGRTRRQVRGLKHDPEKWVPVFPRDKREAFARRSCSNKKIERDDGSKKSHPALRAFKRTRAEAVMTRVACIGECMIELKPAKGGLYSRGYGGDTLNTAVYLARLGVDVDYVTALGDDALSDEMIAGWTAEGVGTKRVARLPGKLPGIYMIQTDDNGERRFFHWRESAAARA